MLIVMKNDASEADIAGVLDRIRELGFSGHRIPGAQRVAIGITGNQGAIEPAYFARLAGIEEAYKGKVRIAFKHQPLPFHSNAEPAAEAAMAANEQGKFWEMHDKLFANQQALDRPSLEKYAQEIGLNMNKFTAALDSGKFKDKVDSDAKEGAAVGATGTPTFFINGTRLVGAQPADKFKELIDAELKK